MKQALLIFGAFISLTAFAQNTCNELFISEYVEGWSNNKALEIYNPTSAPVNLSQFFVARYSNGSSTATVGNAIQLSGTIAPHSVYVAVLQKLDPLGVGQEAPVWDSLQSRADGFYCPDYAVSNCFYWNGNDAVMLAKGTLPSTAATLINAANVTGFQIIDLLGKIGDTDLNFFEDLFPLDPLSADILTKSLQRYGQNERSLFTFLESEFIEKVIQENRIFNVADCFDYLISNLNSEIFSEIYKCCLSISFLNLKLVESILSKRFSPFLTIKTESETML